MDKKQRFQISYGDGWMGVWGYPVEIQAYPGVEFFVYQVPDASGRQGRIPEWSVAHKESGVTIPSRMEQSQLLTRKQAVDVTRLALQYFRDMGGDLQQMIDAVKSQQRLEIANTLTSRLLEL